MQDRDLPVCEAYEIDAAGNPGWAGHVHIELDMLNEDGSTDLHSGYVPPARAAKLILKLQQILLDMFVPR